MNTLVEAGSFGALLMDDKSAGEYCMVKFLSGAYTMQDETIIDGNITSSVEIFVNENHLTNLIL